MMMLHHSVRLVKCHLDFDISYSFRLVFAIITAAKGSYIQNAGLGGFAMWQAGGDSNDILLDAIREAIGNSSSGSSTGC